MLKSDWYLGFCGGRFYSLLDSWRILFSLGRTIWGTRFGLHIAFFGFCGHKQWSKFRLKEIDASFVLVTLLNFIHSYTVSSPFFFLHQYLSSLLLKHTMMIKKKKKKKNTVQVVCLTVMLLLRNRKNLFANVNSCIVSLVGKTFIPFQWGFGSYVIQRGKGTF